MSSPTASPTDRKLQRPPLDFLVHMPNLPGPLRALRFFPPLSDAELEAFCKSNESLRIERTQEGDVTVMTPAGMRSSGGNAFLCAQLSNWWEAHREGFIFDSSGGFYLPDGSMLSPDASYITPATLAEIPEAERDSFPHVCPDFVVELMSQSDTPAASHRKMARWIANGVRLGWLLDPKGRRAHVYRHDASTPMIVANSILEGAEPVVGLQLDLDDFWRRFA